MAQSTLAYADLVFVQSAEFSAEFIDFQGSLSVLPDDELEDLLGHIQQKGESTGTCNCRGSGIRWKVSYLDKNLRHFKPKSTPSKKIRGRRLIITDN